MRGAWVIIVINGFPDCPEGLNTNRLNQYNLVSCSCTVLLTNTIRFKTERLESIANSH